VKRAVLCVANPQTYIDDLDDYSIMIVEPTSPSARLKYLLEKSDYSLLITDQGSKTRLGQDYPNERVLFYTSGTTGDSKFYGYSQHQLDLLIQTICSAYELTANDRYVSVMNLAHAHGQAFYWATKHIGCETNFLSVREIRQLPKFDPTFLTAIPGMLNVALHLDFKYLRFIRSASCAMPTTLHTALKNKFKVPVLEAFGMTEAMSHCFTNPLKGQQRIGTVGLPDGVNAKIVNGRLHLQGPTVYREGWIDTGDLAEQDEAGYYRILGRSVDQINVNGYKLNPLSIENQMLNNIPGLIECAIFGSTNVKCLFVGECTVKQVQEFLSSLHGTCRPEFVKQVEHLPTNESGKVSRTWLDTQYQ
jgi:acyl-coenzyme A synthetase/AMP-(fatty) acid ligase